MVAHAIAPAITTKNTERIAAKIFEKQRGKACTNQAGEQQH